VYRAFFRGRTIFIHVGGVAVELTRGLGREPQRGVGQSPAKEILIF